MSAQHESSKLRIPSKSSRIPKNSGGRGHDTTFADAPNSWEFGYAQLRRPKSWSHSANSPVGTSARLRRTAPMREVEHDAKVRFHRAAVTSSQSSDLNAAWKISVTDWHACE